MKIIFFGTAEFAVPVLSALLKTNHDMCGVVTSPDRPQGRGRKIFTSPVKALAVEKGLFVYQPEELRDTVFLNRVQEIGSALFIVVSYGKILPAVLLKIPELFPLNIHASLLPKYRGASPVQWALINGEEKTGVTVIRMAEKLDAGPILLKEEIHIQEEDNAVTLSERLSFLAGELILKSLRLIEEGSAVFTPQNEKDATYVPRLRKEDGLINWQKRAREIYNQVRGMQPWPGSFTSWDNKLLKVWKVKVISVEGINSKPGEVERVGKDGIIVKAGCGKLLFEELQIAGGRRLPVKDFVAGHNLTPGVIFQT